MNKNNRRQSGISLVELLIALLMGAVIAAAMASLFAQSTITREQVNRVSQRIENGRYALAAIAEDIRLAGYYGDLWSLRGSFDYHTDVTGKANPCVKTLADIQAQWEWKTSISPPGITVPVPLVGFEGHGTSDTLPAGCSDILPNRLVDSADSTKTPDILAVRRASTVSIAPSTLSSGNAIPMLQSSTRKSECGTEDGFRVDKAPANLNLHRLHADCDKEAFARPLVTHIYYIASCNVCSGSAADIIPTLKMAEFIGGDFVVRSIAPGIDQLHFEYGLDTDGDGTVNDYRLSTNDSKVNGGEWFDVISVKVYALARDLQDTPGHEDSQAHVLGTKTVPAYGDKIKRHVSSTTVRLVNMGGRRES